MTQSLPLLFLFLVTVSAVCSQDEPQPSCSDSAMEGKFTLNLLQVLAKNGHNVLFSPAGMDTALTLIGFGAGGESRQQISSALGYDLHTAKIVIAAKQQILSETPSSGVIWKSATKIMSTPDFDFNEDYLKEVSKTFPDVLFSFLYTDSPSETANEVNQWVSKETENQIDCFLIPDDITDESDEMLVLNAIFFKGDWKHQFHKSDTRKECFYSSPGNCIMTDMMHQERYFKFENHLGMDAKIIEFPYENEDFSMIVILPNDPENITYNINHPNAKEVVNFMDSVELPKRVRVTLPKFDIEVTKAMKKPLEELGITDVFTDDADLSHMTSDYDTTISNIVYKAKLIVNEEGTQNDEAGTAFAIPENMHSDSENKFDAVTPFVFLIRNKQVGILFAGMITHL